MSTYLSSHKKTIIKYISISLFLIVFDIIYEQFSHGLHSELMRLSFLLPLIGGMIIVFIYQRYDTKNTAEQFLETAIITLVIGFLLHGVFQIYGSESSFVAYFFYIGASLALISIIVFISNHIYTRKEKS